MLKIIRRTILLVLLLAAALLGVIGYSYFIEPNRLTVKTFTVTTEKEVSPCTVVFFTDTHFGEYYDIAHAEEIVDTINGLDPDFVLFGGDLLDNYARDRQALDLEALRDSLSRIEARAGKFAVWGNHDYGGGAVRIYQEFMTSCGFAVLDDESQLFEEYGIRVFGYDDVLVGWTPPELYTIQAPIELEGTETPDDIAKTFIRTAIKARKDYKGSGNPILFTTEDFLTDMLLLEDKIGHPLYDSVEKLATKLRVSQIVTVEVMEGLTREVDSKTRTLMGIIVNPQDYNVGADKGGAINMFDDFDIDYNQQKYLIETRCSGALIKPFSAIAIESYTKA